MIIDINNSIGRRRLREERSAESLIREMDEAKVDMAGVFCFSELNDNDYVLSAVNKYPDRLIGLITINPWDIDGDEKLKRGFDMGFKGLRLDPLRHGFPMDYLELLDPLFKICREEKAPVWAYGTADDYSSPIIFQEMAEAFPEVPLIIGYMGFSYESSSAVNVAKRYENVYLDMTGAMGQNLKRAINTAGADKVLLGSGTPEASYFKLEIEKVKALVTDEKECNKILGENSQRLFGIKS